MFNSIYPPHTPQRVRLRHFDQKKLCAFFYLQDFPIRWRGWLAKLAELACIFSKSLIVGDKPCAGLVVLYACFMFLYASFVFLYASAFFYISFFISIYLIELKRKIDIKRGEKAVFLMRKHKYIRVYQLRQLASSLGLTRALTRALISYKKQIVMSYFGLLRQYAGKYAPLPFLWSKLWS